MTESVEEGTKDADVLYTDVWVSMGEPDEVWAERIKALSPYQINQKAMGQRQGQCCIYALPPGFP